MVALRGYVGFLIGAIAPLAVYLCAFLVVDPLGVTRMELFGPRPFNSMQIKEEIIAGAAANTYYDGLILGTSSVMTLDLDEFDAQRGRRFFNYSLFNSKPSHALAAYRHFKRLKGVPAEVIVGVDFFAYKDGAPAQEEIALTRHLRMQVPGADSSFQYGSAIIRGALSETGIRQLADKLKGAFQQRATVRTIDERGTLVYHQALKEIKAGQYDFQAILTATSNTDSEFYRSFGAFENSLSDLAALTSEITGDGANLVIVLPAIYRDYDINLGRLSPYAPFYSQILRRYGASVVDWRRAPGTDVAMNFIDARHIHPKFSRTLIRTMSPPRHGRKFQPSQ